MVDPIEEINSLATTIDFLYQFVARLRCTDLYKIRMGVYLLKSADFVTPVF